MFKYKYVLAIIGVFSFIAIIDYCDVNFDDVFDAPTEMGVTGDFVNASDYACFVKEHLDEEFSEAKIRVGVDNVSKNSVYMIVEATIVSKIGVCRTKQQSYFVDFTSDQVLKM